MTDQDAFDQWHKKTCQSIVANWKTLKLNSKKKPLFGFAAKVVAIYLKTTVGMRADDKNSLTNQLYPPIDRILLTNVNRELEMPERWKKLPKWTQLTFTEYTKVLKKLEDYKANRYKDEPLCMVERYWEARKIHFCHESHLYCQDFTFKIQETDKQQLKHAKMTHFVAWH